MRLTTPRPLVALDGGKQETPKVAGWKEGAAWLPKTVTLLAGFDAGGPKPGEQRLPDLTPFFGMMSKEEKKELLVVIEKLGNIRIDRVVFGLGDADKDNFEIFLRVTGKANPDWLAEAFKGVKVEERAGGSGPKVRIIRPLHANGKGPAMAIVGDTDFLLAGLESKNRLVGGPMFVASADTTTLDKMLALVAKPGPDATQGALKGDIAKIPAAAVGVVVGEVPSWMRKDAPFPVPQKILAHAKRTDDVINLQVQATLDGEDNAKKLVHLIGQARDAGLDQLAKLQGQPSRSQASISRR